LPLLEISERRRNGSRHAPTVVRDFFWEADARQTAPRFWAKIVSPNMERVVPWSALCALIEPDDPKPGYPKPDDPEPDDPEPGDPKPGDGRPPIGVERMLRLYFWQQWFNLSDPAVEEAVYDWQAMRRVVGIDLGRAPVPDKRRHAACATGSRRTISAGGCSMRCSGIWPRTGSSARPARLSMRSSRKRGSSSGCSALPRACPWLEQGCAIADWRRTRSA